MPGQEASAIAALELDGDAVLLVGERLAGVSGALSAQLAPKPGHESGGSRGEPATGPPPKAGCLPNHGGSDGRDTTAILAAAASGQIGALVVGGVEVNDLPDPTTARYALDKAFVVSLEVRESDVTALADVVFPVAPAVEKSGGYVSWDGNARSFPRVLETQALPDARVLRGIADELGKSLKPVPDNDELDHEYGAPQVEPAPPPTLKPARSSCRRGSSSSTTAAARTGSRSTGPPRVRPCCMATAATLAAAGIEPGGFRGHRHVGRVRRPSRLPLPTR